jgi:hypothetical protein
MSYHQRKGIVSRRRHHTGHQPMGDALSTIISGIGSALDVAGDPYLPEIICRVQELHAIKSNLPRPLCPSTPLGLPGGVGLGRVVLPLRAFVFAEANPWAYAVAAAAIVGVPMWIGYELGRK